MQDHLHLILAVVLFQSIISFQPRPDQRALSRMYHDVLIMVCLLFVGLMAYTPQHHSPRTHTSLVFAQMIRKTGLIKTIGTWAPPSLGSTHNLEEAWRDWAHYETFKRSVRVLNFDVVI